MTTAADHVRTQAEEIDALGHYAYGWSDSDVAGQAAQRGHLGRPA